MRRFWTPKWSQNGPQNRSKVYRFCEKVSCTASLAICFQPSRCFLICWSILPLILEGPTLENLFFPRKNNDFQKTAVFSKDGPRGPKITSKSEENCPQMLQKSPKRQTNVAFGAVQKHTEQKNRKKLQNRVQKGPKDAWIRVPLQPPGLAPPPDPHPRGLAPCLATSIALKARFPSSAAPLRGVLNVTLTLE